MFITVVSLLISLNKSDNLCQCLFRGVWTDKCLFTKIWCLTIEAIWLFYTYLLCFVWLFMSQLQYRNKNQNFLSNFVFQFIKKKMKWHFRYTDLCCIVDFLWTNIFSAKGYYPFSVVYVLNLRRLLPLVLSNFYTSFQVLHK